MKILYYPDKRLRKIADPVKVINQHIQNIIDDMFEIIYIKNGIGLAATQINIHKRIIVIDISKNHNKRLVLINPELLEKNGKTGINEGCLSIPNCQGYVIRSKMIKIRALDRNGNYFELKAEDLLSICIQHEMDHLLGKLFIDYFSSIKKQRMYKR